MTHQSNAACSVTTEIKGLQPDPAFIASRISHPETPTSKLRAVFSGSDGLRAGWSLLLFVIFAVLLGRGVSTVTHLLVPPSARHSGMQPPLWLSFGGSALSFAVVALAAFFVSLIERRPFSEYGLGSLRGRAGRLLSGLAMGFALLSVLIALLYVTGKLKFNGFLLESPVQMLGWGALFAISFLFTALFEEFAFRGFLQFTLTRGIASLLRLAHLKDSARIAFWLTALVLAVLFGLAHRGNQGEGLFGLFSAGAIGFLFAFSLWRTGSLWWAVGFHAAWNWAESFFYGTADSGGISSHRLISSSPLGNPVWSGGSIGPEGSIWILAILVLLALFIGFALPARRLATEQSR